MYISESGMAQAAYLKKVALNGVAGSVISASAAAENIMAAAISWRQQLYHHRRPVAAAKAWC